MRNKLFQSDSEVAVLSMLLDNPEKIYDPSSLKPFMFASAQNSIIYSSMLELSIQNTLPEPRLLEEYLKSTNQLKDIGGPDYLSWLIKQTYDVVNYTKFERMIIDSYKARAVLTLSAKTPSMVDETSDINNVLTYMRGTLDDLEVSSGGDQTFRLSAVLPTAYKEIEARRDNPGIRGFSTGSEQVDKITGGYSGGDLWIIAARPGHGKTSWILNSILNADYPSLIFSKEMSNLSLVERLTSISSKIDLQHIRLGALNNQDMKRIQDSFKGFENLNIYIDDKFSAGLDYTVSTIRKYHKLHGIQVVYLDYIQLMAERGTEATHELGRISRAMKNIANDLDICVVIVSQLNRDCERRDNKRPMLSDLRQSGNLEEDADNVVFLYRDTLYNKITEDEKLMEFGVSKQRNGPIGIINLKFEKECTYIYDGVG